MKRIFDLTAEYEKLIPQWRSAYVAELIQSAKRSYPNVYTLEDVLEATSGLELREVPFLIDHLLIRMWQYLLEATKRQYKPEIAEGFVTPEVLAYDAALRAKKGTKGTTRRSIKYIHKRAVEAAVHVRFFTDALNLKLREEAYGRRIMAAVFSDDKKAIEHLNRMLKKKAHGKLSKKEQDLFGDKLDKEDLGEIAGETITNKVDKVRKSAPDLTHFLPEELKGDAIRVGLGGFIKRHVSEDAQLFSDAVTGGFNHLPYVYVMDIKNELEKLSAQQRYAVQEISIQEESGEQRLREPRYRKIKMIYDKLLEDPDSPDTEIAESLGIHRNKESPIPLGSRLSIAFSAAYAIKAILAFE